MKWAVPAVVALAAGMASVAWATDAMASQAPPAADSTAVAPDTVTVGISPQHPPLTVSTAVAPDTVTVGEPFTSMVRVMAPPGSRVEFRGVTLADSVQQVDTVRVIGAAADSGATAAYRLVAWVAAPVRAVAEVRVILADSSVDRYEVSLAMPVLRSVLPPGETPEPRPGRGVVPLPAAGPVWPWVAAGALLAAAALLLARRRGRATEAPGDDPRAWAIAALARLDLQEDPRTVYDGAARVLRRYLAAVRPDWGEEWTSSELVPRVSAAPEMEGAASDALARLLARADRVKFAGYSPPAGMAAEFVADARAWIEAYPPVSEAAEPREAA